MPLLRDSAYRPPAFLRNGHLQTIYPALLRKVPLPPFVRERITTADSDFLDLDWLRQSFSTELRQTDAACATPLAILCHGLEGNSRQGYMRGMARALFAQGWDVLAWNFRGCSGEPNLRLRSYHSGATDDLEAVIAHALVCAPHRPLALIGFSLGGNIVLKYLGEHGQSLAATQHSSSGLPSIVGAVAISVPCDLAGSTTLLERKRNRLYMERFLQTLRYKIREKNNRFPGTLDIRGLSKIRTFGEFDNRYTAPLHGFRNAEHYWHQCSCLRVIEHIAVPTLLLNAADDPFLSAGCFPTEVAAAHAFLHLEIPRHGGHVGFARRAADGLYYSELRAGSFLATARKHRDDTARA